MRPDDARGSTSGPEPGTPRPWAGVVLVCLGALAFALFCHFPLVHSDGSIDVDALKSVPRPVEFIIFDHTTYLAIARNAETGVSVFTEPLGIITSSSGPTMQLVALLNRIGSLGIGAPVSLAWSA